jgi:hypothetical protein
MKLIFLNIFFLICFSSSTPILNAQGIIKDDFLVNNDSVDISNRSPAITMNSSGEFIITWSDHRNGWGNWDVFFQMYNENGNPVGTNVLVNDDASIYWAQTDPSIAMNSGGNFVITWEDDRIGYDAVYYQLFDSNGNPIGTNQQANDASAVANDPAAAMDDAGNFVLVWRDYRGGGGNTDIYFQLFDSGGNKIGTNVIANEDPGGTLQEVSSIAIDGNGNFVIAWKDFRNGTVSDIYMQRFNSSGSPLGSNIRVDDDTGNASQYISSIAMDGSGNFVIVWDDDRGGYSIYYQMYDNNGNAIGSNVKVNDDIGNPKHTWPSVSMESAGDFVITWMSYTDPTYPDVEAQKYFANGNPNGRNNLVVVNGPNEIEAVPVVAVNSTQIAFAWDDNRRQAGRSDIYGKLVNWNWDGVTDVEIIDENIPKEFSLWQNYPNPFNPLTKIKYQIPKVGFVFLKVYDVLGIEIATLVNKEKAAGLYEVDFDGAELPSGIYFYKLKAGDFAVTKKMILLR